MVSKLSRRDFLKLTSTAGAGLILAIYLDGCAPAPIATASATGTPAIEPTSVPPAFPSTPTPVPVPGWDASVYLRIDIEGNIIVTAFRSEMGQGIRTAIAMILADELDADWKDIRIIQAPADPNIGNQMTGGSLSIINHYDILRRAGATVRQMLVNAAAGIWNVDSGNCKTESSAVIHPDGVQRLTYSELVEVASNLEIPDQVTPKSANEFHIIGTNIGHWDTPSILTGKAIYGTDIRIPGMVFAAIARCPVFGGTFVTFADNVALAVPGVRQVIALKDRIAVVADNTWAAFRGRDALEITWDEGWGAKISSASLRESLIKLLPQVDSTKENVINAVYEIPYEAHATMEPMNCTAYVHDGICEVWAPTQDPQQVRRSVSTVTGLDQEKVIVQIPLIGGGFGRRLQTDYAEEAAQLSQIINAPVQVMWARADDIQHDFYHDMHVMNASSSLKNYRIPLVDRKIPGSHVPTGAWRSVDNFPEAFGVQSFIDEIATALKRDPLDLRFELYSGRALDVIRMAAEKAGWSSPLPESWGRGIAYHATFGVTHVAQVAEVSVDEQNRVAVHRVICAVDCGKVINPDNVVAQMEGGIVFGLTAALKAQIEIEDGRVIQSNFHDYPILRMDEMPTIEVYIVESDNLPSGIGEMGVPPIAPAVANAVFSATGKRIRKIPILPDDLLF